MPAREIRAGIQILPYRARIGNPASYKLTLPKIRELLRGQGDGLFYVILEGDDAVICFDDARMAMLVKMNFGK